MENKRPKLITTRGAIIDLALTVLFFAFLMTPGHAVSIKKHVPWTEAPEWVIWASAAYCSVCLAGVFWVALSLFRVTLVDQLSVQSEQR